LIDVKKLKRRREALGLTQTTLAKRIGITQTHYSRIEKGLRGVSQETLEALLQVLEVSIGDIWESDAAPPDGGGGAGARDIVLEIGEGRGRTRCALPPTPESYAFLASQLRGDDDPRLEAIVNMWEMADEAAREKIFEVLFHLERKTRDSAADGDKEIANS
jgi:transcriptional regulator with XRE-family HTH domain